MNKDNTGQWIQQVLEGDVEAYEHVVTAHQRKVWALVSYYFHNLSQITEVVDATFVKAYFALEQFQAGRDFEAWIKSIARNEVRMVLRKAASEKTATKSYAERIAAQAALSEAEEERTEERKSFLEDCLQKLTRDHRELIAERYTEDKSIGQIAEECSRSVDAVKKNLSRIRGQLRICIEKKAVQHAS